MAKEWKYESECDHMIRLIRFSSVGIMFAQFKTLLSDKVRKFILKNNITWWYPNSSALQGIVLI